MGYCAALKRTDSARFLAPRMLRLLPLLCLLFVGCDATSIGELQRLFEFDAVTTPSGITQTDARGDVIREDASDWRTAPIYSSQFSLTFKPYPNPASATQSVQFAGTFSGSNGALIPYRLTPQGDLLLVQGVSGSTQGTAPLFSFPAGQLGGPGLHRVVLLDRQGRIVTFGDVQVLP